MKKKLLVLSTFVFTLGSICGCSSDKTPQVKKHVFLDNVEEYAPVIIRETEGEPAIKRTENKHSFHLFNDRLIPYLSLDEYFSSYCDLYSFRYTADTFIRYSVVTNRKHVKITNPKNDSYSIVDFDRQTVTFSSYTEFTTNSKLAKHSGDCITADYTDEYFPVVTGQFSKGNEITIDLSKYFIDAYFYEGKGYLPINFMNMLFYDSNPNGLQSYYYNGQDMYVLGEGVVYFPLIDEYQRYLEQVRANSPSLNEDFMKFNYGCLAFLMDYHYGLNERTRRYNNEKHVWNKNSFDILNKYKDKLLSNKNDEFDEAILEIFDNEFDDGGHSQYYPISLTSTNGEAKQQGGNDGKYISSLSSALNEYRFNSTEFDIYAHPENVYFVNEYNDTKVMYFTFDMFGMANISREEMLKDPDNMTTINLTHKLNEKIRENNIKNLVIDLSINGGGEVEGEQFLQSYLCHGYDGKLYNSVDNSITSIHKEADVNYDGKIDENDFLPNDVNIYFIVSSVSYSCGNMLPTYVKEALKDRATILGSHSGGGTCSNEMYAPIPNGTFFNLSSHHRFIYNSSTVSNLVDLDNGVISSKYIIENEKENISKFYDRDAISKTILN